MYKIQEEYWKIQATVRCSFVQIWDKSTMSEGPKKEKKKIPCLGPNKFFLKRKYNVRYGTPCHVWGAIKLR